MTCSTFLGSAKTPTIQPTHWLRGRIRGPPGGRFNLYVEIFLPMRDPWDGTGIFTDHEWLIFMVNPYFTNMILHEWLIKSWYIPFFFPIFPYFSYGFLCIFLKFKGRKLPRRIPKRSNGLKPATPYCLVQKGWKPWWANFPSKILVAFFGDP